MKRIISLAAAAAVAAAMILTPLSAFAEEGSDGGKNEEVHSDVAAGLIEGGASGAGYSSTLYNSLNGLPTSESNAVLQTSDGFVWIGSYSGLIRYDGNEFYRFDASYGISSVVSLFEDSRERLWIGTNDAGVIFYEDGKFTSYFRVGGLKTSSIHSIAEDISGNILIATNLGIAYIDTSDELHLLDAPQLNAKDVAELRQAPDGIVYGRTADGMVFAVEDMHITSSHNSDQFETGEINALCPDTTNKDWAYLGTINSEILHVDLSSSAYNYSVTDVSPLVNINRITDIDGQIWVCADNGIGFIDRNGKFVKLENLPMNNSIDDISYDHEGNLWFASSRQGVMKISKSVFTDINLAAGLDKMVVNTTCLHDGKLYIGTDSGLHAIDAFSYTEVSDELTELLASARVRCIKEDSKGNLWLSTYSGLFCGKKGGGIESFTMDTGFASNKVRVSEELSDGRIAAASSKGVYFIKDMKIDEFLSYDNGLSGGDVLTICDGGDGRIYFGTDGGGVYILNNNALSRISIDDGLRSEVIMRIKKDPTDGTLWLVTSNSIAYLTGDTVENVDKFPYSNNFDIIFDGKGGLWILSSNGIYVTTSEQLKSGEEPQYLFYDTSCGLPSTCTANSRSCIDDNGGLYISGNSGVSLVNIFSASQQTDNVRLTIPFIDIDTGKGTQTITLKDKHSVTIPSDCKRLTIYAYALTFSLSDPSLSYRLTGFDDQSYLTTKKSMRPITYTNLAGGKYSFDFSTVNTLTGLRENTVTLSVDKELSLFEQYWFKLIIVLGAGIIAFVIFELIHRRREAALIREKQKKQLLIDEMTKVFAKCIDMKDKYTNGHSFRVAEYSKLLAEKMGKSESETHDIYNIAMLHDIGKISIPDSVLNKPGKPTDEEYEILKTHTSNGYEVLKDITIAPELSYGAGYHHERLDGKGYPNGLTGDEIPEVAQIIAVADTFDAMYSTRPYRKQMEVHVVLDELKKVSGTQLNGDIVNDLVELVDEGKIGQREL
ncbi:MAG: HD domain-containing protein [Ruminiclostridium sp.]|nr:HD domain-containing protein [Ruminiclostridium sp.]